ncbi:MAG: hypothetical protein V4736_16385 [Bdellovibrionota bacterium]
MMKKYFSFCFIFLGGLFFSACVTRHVNAPKDLAPQNSQQLPATASSDLTSAVLQPVNAPDCEDLVETAPRQYTASRQLEYGDCIFERGEVQSALDVYEKVYSVFKLSSPAIRTQALLRRSRVLERKGQWVDSLILLKEAEPFIEKNGLLIDKTVLALRLGLLYSYVEQRDTAQKYIAKAEKGFNQLSHRDEKVALADQVAQFYNDYLMPQDFEQSLDVFRKSQPYMMYVLEKGGAEEKFQVLERLREVYMNFYRLVKEDGKIKANLGTDEIDDVLYIQRNWYQKILEATAEAKILIGLDEDSIPPEVVGFQTFIAEFEKQVIDDLYKVRRETALTPESNRIHSIKRETPIIPKELLPEEKIK